MIPDRTLYTFFRSSTSYRLRIALAMKGLDWTGTYTDLPGMAHHTADFLAVNPQGLVPVLIDEGQVLTQTLAIMEYLEETYPDPPLLPKDRFERAYVRMLCDIVACDIHPLNNARVLKYLKSDLGQDQAGVDRWYAHWIGTGLAGFEAMLGTAGRAGQFCLGDTVSMADVCLVPQVANARRFSCDLSPYPRLVGIADRAAALAPFVQAQPAGQADAI